MLSRSKKNIVNTLIFMRVKSTQKKTKVKKKVKSVDIFMA